MIRKKALLKQPVNYIKVAFANSIIQWSLVELVDLVWINS